MKWLPERQRQLCEISCEMQTKALKGNCNVCRVLMGVKGISSACTCVKEEEKNLNCLFMMTSVNKC